MIVKQLSQWRHEDVGKQSSAHTEGFHESQSEMFTKEVTVTTEEEEENRTKCSEHDSCGLHADVRVSL